MIDSVLSQDFTDWELIIVDDSTNSETEKVIRKYLKDARITYLKNHKNIGAPLSRNRGLDAATGKWITFLDDDDILYGDNILTTVYKTINLDWPWYVFRRVGHTGENLTIINTTLKHYNWTRDCLFGNALRGDAAHFIKKSLIGSTRNSDEMRSEWRFWYELAKKSNFKFIDLVVQKGGYLEDGLMSTYVPKMNSIYLKQHLFEVTRHIDTWKYVPKALLRILLAYTTYYQFKQKLESEK